MFIFGQNQAKVLSYGLDQSISVGVNNNGTVDSWTKFFSLFFQQDVSSFNTCRWY